MSWVDYPTRKTQIRVRVQTEPGDAPAPLAPVPLPAEGSQVQGGGGCHARYKKLLGAHPGLELAFRTPTKMGQLLLLAGESFPGVPVWLPE